MLKYVLRYGVLNVVIVITFISVLLSAVMTVLIFLSFGEQLTRAGIISSIIIPYNYCTSRNIVFSKCRTGIPYSQGKNA